MFPRFDYVFSYWIFAWYVLYILGLVPVVPKLLLLLGIFVNAVTIYKVPDKFLYLLFGIVLTKLIPFLSIRNVKVNWNEQVQYSAFVFIVYLFWLKVNDEPLLKLRTPASDLLKNTRV